MKNKSDKMFSIRLPDDLYEKFQERCENEGLSVAAEIKRYMSSSLGLEPKHITTSWPVGAVGVVGKTLPISRSSDESFETPPENSTPGIVIKSLFGRNPVDGDSFYSTTTFHTYHFKDGVWTPQEHIANLWTIMVIEGDLASGEVYCTTKFEDDMHAMAEKGYHVLASKSYQIAICSKHLFSETLFSDYMKYTAKLS